MTEQMPQKTPEPSAEFDEPSLFESLLHRWDKIPTWFKASLMGVAVFIASIGYFKSTLVQNEIVAESHEENLDVGPADSRPTPIDFDFVSMDGKPMRLSNYRGKVAIVSFWASWCTPCLIEMPTFKDLSDQFAEAGLVILPLNLDDTETAKSFIPNFWKAEALPFESFLDPEKKAASLMKVENLPSNFIIDRKGRVAMSSYGQNDWSNDRAVEMIRSLLKEPN